LINSYQTTLEFVSKKAKKQLEILNKLYNRFSQELFEGWDFDLEEVSGIIETSREALVRAINSWKKAGLAEYSSPKRGTEIRLLRRIVREEVKIDFTAMREKAARAYKKLDEMEEYVFSFSCRQQYILNYFGDDKAGSCGKCDNCLNGFRRKEVADFRQDKEKSSSYSDLPNKQYGRRKTWEKRNAGNDKADFEEIKVKKEVMPTKLTQLETLELFNKGNSPQAIAAARELTVNTIFDHLCFLIEKKLIKNIDSLVEKKKQEKILAAIKEVGAGKLTPIKEFLGDSFSYEEIKIVRAATAVGK
jgi:ATP-dependent DNA helicase RecQ